ncbi:MAG: SH3 domain-containing protein [Chloroflexi bacterium]|nr:SH3 domain-containing protein [Chloroflexota bacterium]
MTEPRLDDTRDLTGTQPVLPVDPRRTGQTANAPRSSGVPERRKRKRSDRQSSPMFLPAWSVGLMLLMVFGIAVGIVSLVLMLGGQTAPGGEPRVIIVTGEPTPTSPVPEQPTADPIVTPTTDLSGQNLPLPTFALEGPTLAPVILSPTPLTVNVGSAILVNTEGLNVRPEAGLDNTPLFTAALGEGFNVVGGPVQSAGLTWWEIQSPDDTTRRGWAAADYLDVFSP